MFKPKNHGRLALSRRSGRLSLKACDAQNLGHNLAHTVGFPIRDAAFIAKDAGLSRESLYKALSGDRAPSFETILKVTQALGIKLHAQPA